jgi:trehalose 6-phosphate synthase complex regulatory subunit
MSDEEAESRWQVRACVFEVDYIHISVSQDLHAHVITQTAQSFVTTFLSRCIRVHDEHLRRNPLSIPVLPLSPSVQPASEANEVLDKYKQARHVLMLIDFESTLWREDPLVTREVGFVVPDHAVCVLKELVAKKKNTVWILSGLPVRKLDKIADAVPGLGLM